MRLQRQRFTEGGDGGERIVELVRHSRHQGAELRQTVGLEQALLQQNLPRYVQRQEQQLGHRLPGIDVHDDGPDVACRLARELEGEPHVLPPGHGVLQRGGEETSLVHRGPLRQRPAAWPGARGVTGTQESYAIRIRVEDLALRREDQGGRGQRVEQLQVEAPLALERAQHLGGARLRRELLVHRPERHDDMVVGTPCDPRFQHRAREFGRSSGSQAGLGFAVGEHLGEHALELGPPGGREHLRQGLTQRAIRREPRDFLRPCRPRCDRAIGRDRGHAHVETVEYRFRIHTSDSSDKNTAPLA